ncbi:MAG: DUF2723 domain-containing protein [bacterium]|nr:DUF2723 domain-containing protein [bacterium]
MIQEALKKPTFWAGLIIFSISWTVILLTKANTLSYWDCGEFAACAYTLGVPHPPGSPLFILVGRLFSMLPFGEVASRVTHFSSLSGAFTILLTYLITLRLIRLFRGFETTPADTITNIGASCVGALTLAFSPSFWFNVVESEVYGVSLFLTVLVIWLVLKWSDDADSGENDHFILLATYLNGLAITIHLLNILTIPTIFLIIYYLRKRLAYVLLVGWAISLLIIDLPLDIGVPFTIKFLSIPIAFGFFLYFFRKNQHENSLIPFIHLLTFLGFTLYALIVIRAQLDPMINENDPSTLSALKSYLSREQYGTENMFASMFDRKAPFWEYQIKKMYLRYFDWNFIGIARDIYPGEPEFANNRVWRYWGLPFFLGVFGMIHHFLRDKKRAFANLVLFIMTGIAIVIYLNQDDPQPRERDYAYTGSFFAFSLWVGIGVVAIIENFREMFKKYGQSPVLAGTVVILGLLFVPGRMLAVNYHENDRTNNYVAFDYSRNILESCEQNAILFTNGDNDTFPLWYLQEVENIRKDVAVVNLSLINTGWYIKQMRDKFNVPISYSDDYIAKFIDALTEEALMVRYWPPQRRRITLRTTSGPIIWDVPATMFIPLEYNQRDRSPNFIRVQDQMIIEIVTRNIQSDGTWKRPIYFAATVANSSMIGLANYSSMEGLAFHIKPNGTGQKINPEKMFEKLVFTFKNHYRHLNDPSVYYNENETRLLQNYRSCFLQLAFHYYQMINTNEEKRASSGIPEEQWETRFYELTNREKVLFLLDRMEKVMPSEVIPFDMDELELQIGKMYHEFGRPEELQKRLKKIIEQPQQSTEQKLNVAGTYLQFFPDKLEEASKLFDEVLGPKPTALSLFEAGEKLYRAGLDSAAAMMFRRASKDMTLPEDKITKVVTYFIQLSLYGDAEQAILPYYLQKPQSGTILGALTAVYERSNQPEKVVELLSKWLKERPNDVGAQERLELAKKQIKEKKK